MERFALVAAGDHPSSTSTIFRANLPLSVKLKVRTVYPEQVRIVYPELLARTRCMGCVYAVERSRRNLSACTSRRRVFGRARARDRSAWLGYITLWGAATYVD